MFHHLVNGQGAICQRQSKAFGEDPINAACSVIMTSTSLPFQERRDLRGAKPGIHTDMVRAQAYSMAPDKTTFFFPRHGPLLFTLGLMFDRRLG